MQPVAGMIVCLELLLLFGGWLVIGIILARLLGEKAIELTSGYGDMGEWVPGSKTLFAIFWPAYVILGVLYLLFKLLRWLVGDSIGN